MTNCVENDYSYKYQGNKVVIDNVTMTISEDGKTLTNAETGET